MFISLIQNPKNWAEKKTGKCKFITSFFFILDIQKESKCSQQGVTKYCVNIYEMEYKWIFYI